MIATRTAAASFLLATTAAATAAGGAELPPIAPQPTTQLVVDEHLAALNACDWRRIMAQYPPEILFILPNGTWVEGRPEIGKLFEGFCKPRGEGGFQGATFVTEKAKTVGDTVSVSWRVEADWLATPYKGADAYVTRDGLMYTQVTTFDPAGMKFK